MKDTKRRQPFVVENSRDCPIAYGDIYEDGSCKILWRRSLGCAYELHQSIGNMFGIEKDAKAIKLVDQYPDLSQYAFEGTIFKDGSYEIRVVPDPKAYPRLTWGKIKSNKPTPTEPLPLRLRKYVL